MIPFYYMYYLRRRALILTKDEIIEPPTSFSVRVYRTVQLIDLGSIRREVQDLNVDLGDLVLEGKGSVRDLFHPETKYSIVAKEGIPSSSLYKIHIAGSREKRIGDPSFDILLSHQLMHSEAVIQTPRAKSMVSMMDNLYEYLFQRQVEQSISTYRKM